MGCSAMILREGDAVHARHLHVEDDHVRQQIFILSRANTGSTRCRRPRWRDPRRSVARSKTWRTTAGRHSIMTLMGACLPVFCKFQDGFSGSCRPRAMVTRRSRCREERGGDDPCLQHGRRAAQAVVRTSSWARTTFFCADQRAATPARQIREHVPPPKGGPR